MNAKAKSLGMLKTNFVDPTGDLPGNTSTPEDLFMLAKYILNNRSFVFNLTTGKIKSNAYGTSIFSDLGNFNDYAGMENFSGGKTGKTTEAGETSLHVFRENINGEERPIAIIILGSENHKAEADKVLNYLNNWK
jgi:D-alanyl-D-alanine carboxypeptidase